MKTLLAGTAAGVFALASVAFSGDARAQCYWTGFDWSCPTGFNSFSYQRYWGPGSFVGSRNLPSSITGFPPSGGYDYPGPRPSPSAGGGF